MILVDSSAWVEFDRATGSPADLRVRDLISGRGPGATTEPVLMEVLLDFARVGTVMSIALDPASLGVSPDRPQRDARAKVDA